MSVSLQVEERKNQTKGSLRQLRKAGKVPGVVYGKQIDNATALSVDEKQLQTLLRSNPNAVVEIEVPSAGKQPVMLGEIQRDSLSRQLLHVDFHQINMNEEVRASVRVDVIGESEGVKEGGVLQILQHEIEIQCLPNRIPESIEVDISKLQIGENLLVSELKLPEGVEVKTEAEAAVVTVLAPQKEISEEEAAKADEVAEEAEARSEEAKMEDISTSE
ncbi:50S ribosomal protein L25/general stress protein Ctc [Paenibacillus abyssi]|uniref:Large ribosomal subunit protein bL25 n=1 Tax=Paenibacillus abyssi TaxID=1340531 RepID=A0A917LHT4_9BACL|nr:50S ribosomal protein L25/general stress protein Ctc [Paenibacillus abyssi]GGG24596.1 50S ribosomal protein L25 [Paenibacillus abyssi]